jgi:murein DD-endopeptidase MepM/ murein hydrolase activator NlpD
MNETDARSVFQKILDDYAANNGIQVSDGTQVDFVEKIEYVQGLYPNSEQVMWDALGLGEKLKSVREGTVYYTVQEGDVLSEIAGRYGATTDKLRQFNSGLQETIIPGQKLLVSNQVNYVRVKVVKTEQRQEVIPYKTVEIENSSIFKGSTSVLRRGAEGKRQITERVTYIDGVRVSVEEVDRVTLSEPVDKRVYVGTKTISNQVSGSYGSPKVSTNFVWPVIGLNRVGDRFGYYAWRGRMHYGVDISGSAASGKVIVAVADGVVQTAGYNSGGYGYHVVINHGNGLETLYAHCLKDSISVRVGQRVSQGQAIARVGNTGNSTGAHLPFEVHINGRKVDPSPYLGL